MVKWDYDDFALWIAQGCDIEVGLSVLELICSGNNLNTLPSEIGHLINLQVLYISNNNLTTLPPSICQLINLQELFCSYNNLTTLPPDIGLLINLQILGCHVNLLTTLPTKIGSLINLQKLYCHDNNLTTLPPEICQLINLKQLYVDNNNLTTLPPEICQLINLQELHCYDNNLTTLPPEICQLINLQILGCHDNNLTTLPPELVNLQRLTNILYDNNPIEYIPPNVLRFIDRIQDETKTNNNVYGDTQSVHNSDVQKSINKSIQYILTQKPIFNKDTIKEFIISCPNISKKLKEILLEYSTNTDVHSIYNITFEELLISVLSLIEHPNNKCKEEIYKVLEQEMSDSICKCFTGRMSRLVNCLNGFDPTGVYSNGVDPNISVTISSNEQLSTIVLLIKEKLGLAYTVEEHKRLLDLEMKEREYTEEVIQEWLTYLD